MVEEAETDGIVARLGNVLYWIGCGLAVLMLAGTLVAIGILITGYSAEPTESAAGGVFLAIAAAACWGIGRGFRYVLAGK